MAFSAAIRDFTQPRRVSVRLVGMTQPILATAPRSQSTAFDDGPVEHDALACLPERPMSVMPDEAQAPQPSATKSPGVAALVQEHTATNRPLASEPPSLVMDVAQRCGDDFLKLAVTCGTALFATPATLGAAILTALPCAVQSVSVGKCIAEANAANHPGVRECEASGGIPLVTREQILCFIER